nr:MAG TPA: hypothetical protein [Herelleviridae sp.]
MKNGITCDAFSLILTLLGEINDYFVKYSSTI